MAEWPVPLDYWSMELGHFQKSDRLVTLTLTRFEWHSLICLGAAGPD